MARTNLNKPIVELDKPGGKVIAFWNSAKEASEFHKIHVVNISYNVNNKTKQAKGKYFRFATLKEINTYHLIQKQITPVEPANIADVTPIPLLTDNNKAEIIPEKPQHNDIQQENISEFNKMLQEYKKRFNENSE